MPEAMKNNADVYEVRMPRRFTFDDNHKFHTIITEIAAHASRVIVLDMKATEFMDSAGLGLLLLAREEAGKAGKVITIRNPQSYVSKLFSNTRFDELFRIE